MTPGNQTLAQDSLARIVAIAPRAALLCDRLFVLDGSLKPLFKGEMAEQDRKLMAMIGTAAGNLGNLDAIVPKVGERGRHHAAYGVEPAHYDTVFTVPLRTLPGLGEAFTPRVEAAWTDAHTILATVPKDAAAA